MANGTQDPIVQYQWGEMAKETLLAIGYSLEWRSYPIAHQICAPELGAVSQFIQRQLVLI